MFNFLRENIKWNMFHLYKIEKRVNQGNVIPRLFLGETSITQKP